VTSKPVRGDVIVEALSAILKATGVQRITMNDGDYSALVTHINAVGPLNMIPQDSFGSFMGVEVKSLPTVPRGEAEIHTTAGKYLRAEYRVIWETLHGVPPTRFDRIDRDLA